jgi:hypothetical protein
MNGVFDDDEQTPAALYEEMMGVHSSDQVEWDRGPQGVPSFNFNPSVVSAEMWVQFQRSAIWAEIQRYLDMEGERADNACRKKIGVPLYRAQGAAGVLERLRDLPDVALAQLQGMQR